MPRPRQVAPSREELAKLYADRGSVRGVAEALGCSAVYVSKLLRREGIQAKRAGRPRKGGDTARLALKLSTVDHAAIVFRARQREAGIQKTAAAIIVEALEAGREPRELSGPPAKVITVALPVEVLDRLRVEADRRGVSLTALARGLVLTEVPE